MRKQPVRSISSDLQTLNMSSPAVNTRSKRSTTTFDPHVSISKRRKTDMIWPENRKALLNCSLCRKEDKAATLLKCKGRCTNGTHLKCIQLKYPLFGKKCEKLWLCDSCQFCSICKKRVIEGIILLQCCDCFKCCHSNCLGVSIEGKLQMAKENRFRCEACEQKSAKENSKPRRGGVRYEPVFKGIPEIDSNGESSMEEFCGFDAIDLANVPPRPVVSVEPDPVPIVEPIANDSTQNEQRSLNENFNMIEDETNIPNMYEWSTNEVYEYFKVRYPRQAHVFENEEIDGQAICLLKREDVLQNFNIKVGPSLKIFEHILKLQAKMKLK